MSATVHTTSAALAAMALTLLGHLWPLSWTALGRLAHADNPFETAAGPT